MVMLGLGRMALAALLLVTLALVSQRGVHAESLKEMIQARLEQDQEEFDTVEDGADEDDEDDLEDSEGDSLLQMGARTMTAEEVELQEEALIRLSSQSHMSFDCWTRTHEQCKEVPQNSPSYCVWRDNQCVISPAAVALICQFYCEKSICLQTLPTAPEDAVCIPKPSSIAGLCSAFKAQEGCSNQSDLCSWVTPSNKKNTKRCVDAPDTCCALANKYCAKRTKAKLAKAKKACANFSGASPSAICEFASTSCTLPQGS